MTAIPAVVFPAVARAQTASADLTTLKTADSPAFVALGLSPSEVQRPTTPKAFAATLASSFLSTNGAIPQGLALEVAPYWLVPHPNLGFYEYANSGIGQLFYRNLTVSVATTSETSTNPSSSEVSTPTNAAVGIRTSILRPPLSDSQRQCVTSIHVQLNSAAKDISEAVDAELDTRTAQWWQRNHSRPLPTKPGAPPQAPSPVEPPTAENVPPMPTPGEPEYEEKRKAHEGAVAALQRGLGDYLAFREVQVRYEQTLAEFNQNRQDFIEYQKHKHSIASQVQREVLATEEAARLAELDKQLAPCMSVINARGDGLSVDVAGATAVTFTDGSFQGGNALRQLVWGAIAYSASPFSFVGLGRYVRERTDSTAETKQGYDIGGRIVVAVDRWGVSAEAITRKLGSDDAQRRYAGGVDYRLVDGTWINMTLGKDYGVGDEGSIIALASLQFNLGDQRLQPLSARMQ